MLMAIKKTAGTCVATPGSKGAQALQRGSFDLLLLGIRFDEFRALEFMRDLNADASLRRPPVVGMRGTRATYRVSPEVFDLPMRAMGARDVIDFSDIPLVLRNDRAWKRREREARRLRAVARR